MASEPLSLFVDLLNQLIVRLIVIHSFGLFYKPVKWAPREVSLRTDMQWICTSKPYQKRHSNNVA